MKIPAHFPGSMQYAVGLTFVLFIAWEVYWRQQGHRLSRNEDNAAWANFRARVDDGHGPKVVIIGSSRLKFDIDIPAFREATGVTPIQLALHGSCPLPALHDLANDTLFTGTLLIGMTEGLFFAPSFSRPFTEMQNRVAYYHSQTPAQRASFKVSRALESTFVSLDQEYLSLNALYDKINFPPRPGVRTSPLSECPIAWSEVDENRQNKLADKVLYDTAVQMRVRNVWNKMGMLNSRRTPAGDTLMATLEPIRRSIEKLKHRGVQVFFVKPPVDTPYREAEKSAFPREIFWDKLLAHTNTPGVHFEDHATLKDYRCPEGSHLSPADAVTYTKALIDILKSEKGWKVPVVSQ